MVEVNGVRFNSFSRGKGSTAYGKCYFFPFSATPEKPIIEALPCQTPLTLQTILSIMESLTPFLDYLWI